MFTEEQRLIQESARTLATRLLIPQSPSWNQSAVFPQAAREAFASQGFMGMLVPPEYDGVGASMMAYVLALKEIARGDGGCSTVLSVHNSVACLPILQFGNTSQKNQFLRPLATGQYLGCFALTEPQAGSDAANIQTTAVRENNHYRLNGVKQFITSGHIADIAIVFAKTNTAISAFIVPTKTPGYKIGRIEHKMGQATAPIVQIILENCLIPVENLLGTEGQGYKIALSQLESGRIGIAAQCLGMATKALEISLEYAKQRTSFNKPLIEHQAIAFTLAEMATQLEAATQLTFYAARLKDNKQSALQAAAMAKLFSSEAAEKIAYNAIQILGGYGYLSDFGLEQLYRDIRVTTIYEGTSEVQKMIISKELGKQHGL